MNLVENKKHPEAMASVTYVPLSEVHSLKVTSLKVTKVAWLKMQCQLTCPTGSDRKAKI